MDDNPHWWAKYMGIPFAEKGRSMDSTDCWGLVKIIYENELGITLPSYTEYYETTNDRKILAETIQNESSANWDQPTEPKPFDVIILNMRGLPMHVGVVTKPNYMIHCAKDINTVHENYTTMRWKHKVIGLARWRD